MDVGGQSRGNTERWPVFEANHVARRVHEEKEEDQVRQELKALQARPNQRIARRNPRRIRARRNKQSARRRSRLGDFGLDLQQQFGARSSQRRLH